MPMNTLGPLSLRENLLRAIRHEAPQHVPFTGEGAYRLVDHVGRKPPRDGVDAWGVTWMPLPDDYRLGDGEPLESFPVAHPATTAAELAARDFPDAGDPALFAGLRFDSNSEDCLIIGQHPAGPLDRFETLLGMTGAMLSLAREPEAAQAALERIADYHIGIARGYLSAGVDAAWLADDYAGGEGPFLSPRLWRRLILPGLARIVEVYRAADALVFFHTCGRAEVFLPDLIDIGISVFNLQSASCDLTALKARYGRRIAFWGGLAGQFMQQATPAEVRLATRASLLALGREGGLILGPDQSLAFPPANVAAFVETVRTYGRYPLN